MAEGGKGNGRDQAGARRPGGGLQGAQGARRCTCHCTVVRGPGGCRRPQTWAIMPAGCRCYRKRLRPSWQQPCPGGETGRRRGLKIPRREACRFESDPGHHLSLWPTWASSFLFCQRDGCGHCSSSGTGFSSSRQLTSRAAASGRRRKSAISSGMQPADITLCA